MYAIVKGYMVMVNRDIDLMILLRNIAGSNAYDGIFISAILLLHQSMPFLISSICSPYRLEEYSKNKDI